MSEPRYPGRVSDPDETTRIPKEALEGLRDADARESGHPSKGSATPVAPSGAGSKPDPGGNGSHPGSRNGVSGSPVLPGAGAAGAASASRSTSGSGRTETKGFRSSSDGSGGSGVSGGPSGPGSGSSRSGASSRPPVFGAGSSTPTGPSVSGKGPAGPSGAGSTLSGSAPGSASRSGSVGSGYTGRSETGYSPSAYSSSHSPNAYSSLGDTPTSVTRGSGLGGATSAGAGGGTASRPSVGARTQARGSSRPPRRARLLVRHIDPWSTLKFSFVLALAMFFVWLVAVGVLYGVLDGMGVFEQLNGLYSEVSGSGSDQLFSPGLVLGTAALIGAVNIVLFTALATIGAFVYNICSDLVGGIEVTLAERD